MGFDKKVGKLAYREFEDVWEEVKDCFIFCKTFPSKFLIIYLLYTQMNLFMDDTH